MCSTIEKIDINKIQGARVSVRSCKNQKFYFQQQINFHQKIKNNSWKYGGITNPWGWGGGVWGGDKSRATAFEKTQVLESKDRNIKASTANIFKKLKETILSK